jgi:hypothetical protein
MQDRVKGPAISLVILGAIGLLLGIMGFLMQGTMMGFYKSTMPADQYAQIEQAMKANAGLQMVFAVVGLAVSGFVLYGGLQLMKLRSRGLVMTAAILGMIPCLGPCCLIGIPIGIWTLVVISKPDVKAAFTS